MKMMMKMPNAVRSCIHVLYCTLDTNFTLSSTLTILMTCDKVKYLHSTELPYMLGDTLFLSSNMPSFVSIIIFFKRKFSDYLQNRTYFLAH